MRLAEIVARLGGELLGNADVNIGKVATLASADATSITFLANPKYRSQLHGTRAGAVIVAPTDRDSTTVPRIVVANPYAYFARVSQLLHADTPPAAGIDPSATVAATAVVAPSAYIGAHVSVGAGAQIGERAIIEHGCSVGPGARIGAESRLYANVVVYHDCVIGARCVLHAGVVIGADGFGWAQEEGRWIKVPQIGRVLIGDDVEIGANTTIDRGTLDDTVIETGVKLDNQIQIGHNVRIGAHTAIAACVGIAGSAVIGKHCSIGGAAGILGHLQICDQVTIAAFSLVTKSIREPGVYGGSVPLQPQRAWLANAARYKQLEAQAEELRQLRRELEQYLQRIAALEQKTP